MKKLFLLLSATLVAFSCSKELTSETTTPDDAANATIPAKVTVAMSDSSSRVALADNGENGYSVTWAEGDNLGAWCWGENSYYNFYKFNMTEGGYDPQVSNFSGSLSATTGDAGIVRYVHPYIGEGLSGYEERPVGESTKKFYHSFDMKVAQQTVSAGMADLITYMVSDEIPYLDALENNTIPTMRHLGAVVDLKLKCEEASAMTLSMVTISGFSSSATIDLREEVTGNYISSTTKGDITLNISDDVVAEGGIYTLPFSIIPCTLSSGESITITATFIDSEGTQHIGTKTITAAEEVVFARATRNTINASISDPLTSINGGGSVVIMPIMLGQTDAAIIPNTYTIGEVTMSRAGNGTAAKVYGNQTEARFYNGNTLTFESTTYDIKRIELTISEGKTNITAGGYSDGVWAGNSDSVTFSFSGTTKITDIKVIYGDGTDAIASISAGDYSLNFTAEGETLTTTISSYNYTDQVISATSDNDRFTPEYDNGTLSITAAANSSSDIIEGTISVSVEGGNTIEIAVAQAGEVDQGAAKYVLVESVDDITDGTYILACEKADVWYIANGSAIAVTSSTAYLTYDNNVLGYYDATTKSFTSTETIDGYAVTVTKTADGYSIKLGDGNYVAHNADKTSMPASSTEYSWLATTSDNYGVYFQSGNIETSERCISVNTSTSSKRFATYKASSTYVPANLYKYTPAE